MKKILFKIGVLSLVVGFTIFGGCINNASADITIAQGESLLAMHNQAQWSSMSRQEQMIRAGVYTASINNGFTDYQAGRASSSLYQQMSTFNPSSEVNSIMVSDIPGVSWQYNNNSFNLLTTNDFHPVVPEDGRSYTNIVNQINSSDNDADVDNSLGQMGNSQEQDNPGSMGTEAAAASSGANNTAGSTTCAQEGLEGVDFLVFHGPLVPCGINKQCANSGDRENDISVPCTLCHFIILIKNVFDLLLSLIITASLFMLTVAGVMYIVSSGGQLTGMAKGIIEKTLLGFGIFLLSWLLVYTLLNMLSVRDTVVGKGSRATWFQFECDTESSFYTPPSDPAHTNPNDPAHTNPNDPAHTNVDPTRSTPANQTPVSPAITDPNIGEPVTSTQSEDVARANLWEDSGGHITFWESSPGATNVREIRPTTRQGLLDFQRESGLDVIVTGGAEADPHASGAYSHANGYKIDIEDTPMVNNYIESNYTFIGNRASSTGARDRVYADNHGNYYVREGSHWDVYYGTPSPPLATV